MSAPRPGAGRGAGTWPAWATEPVEVVAPDPAWLEQGAAEVRRLSPLLADHLVGPVEHIGSTAVPGLAAKPILDLQAPVDDFSAAAALAGAFGPAWHLVPPELDDRPWRRLLVRVASGRRACHLSLVDPTSPRPAEHLTFRDALREDPDLAQRYAALKQDLAARHRSDRERYTAAKAAFVAEVLSTRGG